MHRRTARSSGELELLVADLDRRTVLRARRAQRALQILVRRRRAQHAEPVLGAQQAPAARLRLRAIDEVVGELVLPALVASQAGASVIFAFAILSILHMLSGPVLNDHLALGPAKAYSQETCTRHELCVRVNVGIVEVSYCYEKETCTGDEGGGGGGLPEPPDPMPCDKPCIME